MKTTLSINLENRAKQLISPLILICLILQTGAAVRFFCLGQIFSFLPAAVNVGCDPLLYPFLSYAMYSSAKYEGETVKKYTLVGKLTDGTEGVFNHKSLGMKDYKFKTYTANIQKDEQTLSEFIKLYEAKNGKQIQELLLNVDSYKITKDGIKIIPETVTKTIFKK
ncbi:hypothetical protein VB834_16950 [Limnoraphis robusta Tam1]|uniref:hypothetical protein n=1 Tax=Limnoraphis robusta TaxID=1118279 RepID=UPI002B2148A1|nr:hypothetical protein [Limnoraphis robusta]MEA5499170.1 hypothetical protein [Limnoraphis robusta BA-68 BA1]MEA5540709.1 hypothetical protein [Limnoraphis robusta Tam1]